ncbi:MAG TPA: DnaJ domain-containing protein [Nitriliruptoraceae bacterium]|nr:DnaJ domain-containing protein [Nitriliruptoraceae bacterium]
MSRRATPSEIRQAYRRLARIHHPDAGGDVATFQELTLAVDLLTHPRMQQPEVKASPSTGRRAYPSTAGQYASAAGAVYDTAPADTSMLDATPLPSPAAAWTRDDLARAVAARLAHHAGQVPLVGMSRRPGSFLNRATRHLSDDLLSRWQVQPARLRGMPDHDLEVVARFPSGARKHIDRATLPAGWSSVRSPSTTTATLVVHPSHEHTVTAVHAADAVAAFCEAIAWPLPQWRLPA